MREAILDLRRLLAGESVDFGPSPTRLRNRSASPTPVYMLAAGPRMVELAGEVADGAFLMVGIHPAAIRAARLHLEEGARRAGRSLAGFPVVFVITLGLGSDADVGMRWVRSWFAKGQPFLNYPSVANLRWLKEAGFEVEEAHDPASIPEDQARQIAATGIAPSARALPRAGGSPSARPSCCRSSISMSSTRCRPNSATSPTRTSA